MGICSAVFINLIKALSMSKGEIYEPTFELFTVRGITENGTFLHCTIPRSGIAFEHVHNGLNEHGGNL